MGGSITLQELQQLSDSDSTTVSCFQQIYKSGIVNEHYPAWEVFETALHRRLKEYEALNERKNELSHLAFHCEDIASGNH